jgi:hypothetical protein
MPLVEAVPILMNMADEIPNAMAPEVAKLQADIFQVEAEFRNYLQAAIKAGFLPDSLDLAGMSMFELLNMNRAFLEGVNERIENDKREIDRQNFEMENARESLQGIGVRLRRLLRQDDVVLEGKDLNELFFNISAFVEELTSGGTGGYFVAIADLNDMTQNARKFTSNPGSTDPRQYIPEMMKLLEEKCQSVESAMQFGIPLEAIFKNFDFQPEAYNPQQEPFKFLREKVFQLNMLLGNEGKEIHEPKLQNVFKRFVSLCSALLSHIATSFLMAKEAAGA